MEYEDRQLTYWEIREVPGDHGTIWTEPHAGALANELQDCLSEAQEPRGR